MPVRLADGGEVELVVTATTTAAQAFAAVAAHVGDSRELQNFAVLLRSVGRCPTARTAAGEDTVEERMLSEEETLAALLEDPAATLLFKKVTELRAREGSCVAVAGGIPSSHPTGRVRRPSGPSLPAEGKAVGSAICACSGGDATLLCAAGCSRACAPVPWNAKTHSLRGGEPQVIFVDALGRATHSEDNARLLHLEYRQVRSTTLTWAAPPRSQGWFEGKAHRKQT